MSNIPPEKSFSPNWDVELDREERIKIAQAAWLEAGGPGNKILSINKAAKKHNIAPITLRDRINGAQERHIAHEDDERLTNGEERALLAWILRLQVWGWPARVEQVGFMAEELCKVKGNYQPIGKNWPQKFMTRYPEIKTVNIPPLDKERAMAQDPEILAGWFDLYLYLKTTYEVNKEDIYNIDEKGFIIGVIAKLRVMLNKYEMINGKKKRRNAYITQYGNREWVSLVEYVSLDGRRLPPWIIFKGKQIQKAWKEVKEPGAEIVMSDNDWTDNEVGLEWLQKCFHHQTKTCQKGRYRMLLVDGRASHITTAAI